MKEVNTKFSKVSNEVINQIKNNKEANHFNQYIEEQGIKVKTIMIDEEDDEVVLEGEKFYDLESFKKNIADTLKLRGIKIEDIVANLNVLADKRAFNDVLKSMNSSDEFKNNFFTKYEAGDNRLDDVTKIGIKESENFGISFIIDESDSLGTKTYLELDLPLKYALINGEANQLETTIANLIYTFDLQKQTVQLNVISDNANYTEEELETILNISNNANSYLFKSNEEMLQDMLIKVMKQLKEDLITSRKWGIFTEDNIIEIDSNLLGIIQRSLKSDFNLSENDLKSLETTLEPELKKSVKELNQEIDAILKKNHLDASSVMEDLFGKNPKDTIHAKDLIKAAINNINHFINPDSNLDLTQLKKEFINEVENNKVGKDLLEKINKKLENNLKEGEDFKNILKHSVDQEVVKGFEEKLFTSVDKSIDKMLLNKSNIEEKQNSPLSKLFDIVKDLFISILDSIASIFKNKNQELNAANTLTNALKDVVNKAIVNEDEKMGQIQKLSESRDREHLLRER